MSKCAVCGTTQEKIGESKVSICGQEIKVAHYNIDIKTYWKGHCICEDCMDTYNKIYAMMTDVDFSCGGSQYYSDGRNLHK